jgi:hypothetical protein
MMAALAAAIHLTATVPDAAAADVGVTTVKKKVVRTHKRSRIVADYDGTPVVIVPSHRAMAVVGPDGAPVWFGEYETRYVQGGMPRYTLHGHRIPHVPLPPPRRVCWTAACG